MPPLCIKLFDCRSFGRYTLVGTQVINVKYFVCHPMTKEERERMLLKVPSLEDNKEVDIKDQAGEEKNGNKKDVNKSLEPSN